MPPSLASRHTARSPPCLRLRSCRITARLQESFAASPTRESPTPSLPAPSDPGSIAPAGPVQTDPPRHSPDSPSPKQPRYSTSLAVPRLAPQTHETPPRRQAALPDCIALRPAPGSPLPPPPATPPDNPRQRRLPPSVSRPQHISCPAC